LDYLTLITGFVTAFCHILWPIDFGAFQPFATGNDSGGLQARLALKDQEALAMFCGIVVGFVFFQTE
jgi:hypothetical protein